MLFTHSRLRHTWNVCHILSMVAAIASLISVCGLLPHTRSHFYRLAVAFGVILVPIVVKRVVFRSFLWLATRLGLVRRPAVVRAVSHIPSRTKPNGRLEKVVTSLGAIAIVSFVMHTGLSLYATTFPKVEVELAGQYYWHNKGDSHHVPVLLYFIGMVQGPLVGLTFALALAAAFTNWFGKRFRQSTR